VTSRFLALARQYRRDLDGHLVGSGSFWSMNDLPLDRLCAFVWWYFTHDATPEDVSKLEARIWMPVKNAPIPKESPWSPEREMAGFSALASEIGQ
jgi:hypothetical protein